MPLPAAIQMIQGRFGTALSIFGEDVAMRVDVQPTHDLVWVATGQPVLSFGKVFTVPPGVEGSFEVPAVNQTGWKLQSSQEPFTMWAYTIDITYTAPGGTKKRSLVWQPLVGQAAVDLDLIGGGPIAGPVNGEFAVVTSIAGLTNEVTLEELSALGITGGGGAAATWGTLSGKPAFIGAGTTAANARTAIGAAAPADITAAITALVNGAPGALDTLKELADALAEDDSAFAAINSLITAQATAIAALTPVRYTAGSGWPESRPTAWGSNPGVLKSTTVPNAPEPPSWTINGDEWFHHPSDV